MSVINSFQEYPEKSTYNAINYGPTGPIGFTGATGPAGIGANAYFGPGDAGTTGNGMEGYGTTVVMTPIKTGNIYVYWAGVGFLSASVSSTVTGQIAYGTGGAPAFGAPFTGTTIGKLLTVNNFGGGGGVMMTWNAQVTGLTLGTQYWFDIQYTGGGNHAGVIKTNQVILIEI